MRGSLLSRLGHFAPLVAAAFFCSYALGEETPKLPQTAPVPEIRRDAPESEKLPAPQDVPCPSHVRDPDLTCPIREAARYPPPEASPKGDQQALPEKPPLPEPVKPEPPDPRSAERPAATMPAEELAMPQPSHRAWRGVQGVDGANRSRRLLHPLSASTVKSLGKTIGLEPEAIMNCAMAEASARFMKDVVVPTAKSEFGEDLTSVNRASAYVCRPRHGTHKLSEHAFGNALDIASFTLGKDTRVEVILRPEEKRALLGAVRKAGCGPFKTVLGPGSDEDHALHFHFDLAPRRNGGTFCQ